jgi:hypothetical protein
MKGVGFQQRNGSSTVYWFAQIDGKRVYCGRHAEVRKIAGAARLQPGSTSTARRRHFSGAKAATPATSFLLRRLRVMNLTPSLSRLSRFSWVVNLESASVNKS